LKLRKSGVDRDGKALRLADTIPTTDIVTQTPDLCGIHLKNYELTPMSLNTPSLNDFRLMHPKAAEI